jgi:hypothetical protein
MSFPRHRCAIGRYRRGFEQESAHFAQAFSQAQTSLMKLELHKAMNKEK